MSHVWEVSHQSSQAAADPGLAVTSSRLDSGNCEEMWRNNPTPDSGPWDTRVANNTSFCTILILTEKNDDHLFKAPTQSITTFISSNIDSIIKCFMFNFAPFTADTIHDWGDDRVWAESPAQARGCQAINPWSRWDEECLMTPSWCLMISISPALTPDDDHCCSARWGDN